MSEAITTPNNLLGFGRPYGIPKEVLRSSNSGGAQLHTKVENLFRPMALKIHGVLGILFLATCSIQYILIFLPEPPILQSLLCLSNIPSRKGDGRRSVVDLSSRPSNIPTLTSTMQG